MNGSGVPNFPLKPTVGKRAISEGPILLWYGSSYLGFQCDTRTPDPGGRISIIVTLSECAARSQFPQGVRKGSLQRLRYAAPACDGERPITRVVGKSRQDRMRVGYNCFRGKC